MKFRNHVTVLSALHMSNAIFRPEGTWNETAGKERRKRAITYSLLYFSPPCRYSASLDEEEVRDEEVRCVLRPDRVISRRPLKKVVGVAQEESTARVHCYMH